MIAWVSDWMTWSVDFMIELGLGSVSSVGFGRVAWPSNTDARIVVIIVGLEFHESFFKFVLANKRK
jgi:hypothetical protein